MRQIFRGILLLGVGAHLVENGGNKSLESHFCLLTDEALGDIRIFLHQTVANLYHLIVKGC